MVLKNMNKFPFKTGDSVLVKNGTLDPDMGIEIGGWQGRITEIFPEDKLISIHWDSITLKNMPEEIIFKCEEDGLDWSEMYLNFDEVIVVPPRDSEEDVQQAIAEIEERYKWAYLGRDMNEFMQNLATYSQDDHITLFELWEEFLNKTLTFPFKVRIRHKKEAEMMNVKNPIKAVKLVGVDEETGPFVELENRKQTFHLPLIDVYPVEKDSPNAEKLKVFLKWYQENILQ